MPPTAPYLPPTGPGQPPLPGGKPSRGKKWLTHGATAFLAFLIGVGMGGSDGESSSKANAGSAKPAPRVTVTADPEPEPAVTVTETATVKPKPPKPSKKPGPPTTVEGDGQYLVGEDMKAGTYKTAGPDRSGFVDNCYWARHKDASGEFGSIIANQNLQGQGRVTLNKGEYFETNGCQKWTRVG
ncbi:hypothetical protein [Streptomyces chilikensis]|uniref:hypothetical protein n=1 Tax=Streptomyces chilikensis TaxID=1194079 RepID=UPI001F107854|nr:hypothetical protein [Streptomyces chilikensis]